MNLMQMNWFSSRRWAVRLCEFNLRINNQLGVGNSVGFPQVQRFDYFSFSAVRSPSSVQQIFIFTQKSYFVFDGSEFVFIFVFGFPLLF